LSPVFAGQDYCAAHIRGVIRKISDTKWEHEFLASTIEEPDSHDIEATAEGLKILDDVIPWEEIDRARKALKKT
jgi:hypothetical protein